MPYNPTRIHNTTAYCAKKQPTLRHANACVCKARISSRIVQMFMRGFKGTVLVLCLWVLRYNGVQAQQLQTHPTVFKQHAPVEPSQHSSLYCTEQATNTSATSLAAHSSNTTNISNAAHSASMLYRTGAVNTRGQVSQLLSMHW
jgi:hypothetical protein